MPTEHLPRERFAADVARQLRASESARSTAAGAHDEASGAVTIPYSTHGLITIDPEGHVSFLNPGAAEATGWPADDALGKPAREVLRVIAPPNAREVLASALSDGAVYHVAHARIRRRNGTETTVGMTVAPVMKRGRPSGAVVVLGRPADSADRGAAELDGLAAAAAVVADAPEFEEGAARIVEAALAALDADRVALVLSELPAADPSRAPASQVPYVVAAPPEAAPPRPRTRTTPVSPGAPETGPEAVASLAAAPVTAEGRTVGTMSVSSGRRDHFGPERIRLLGRLVDSLGALWTQARLRRAVHEGLAREKALREAVSIMSGAGPLSDRGDRLLHVVADIASASFAGLAVAQPGMRCVDWMATVAPAGLQGPFETEGSLADAALATGSPVLVRDASETTAWPIGALGEAAKSAVALPVTAGGERLGSMVVVSDRPDAFDASLVDLLTAIAETAGTALRHSRRDVFATAAAHALRTPMTPVLGYSELLMGRGVDPNKRREWTAHIHEATARVLKVIDDLLHVSRLSSDDLTLQTEPVDLGPLLQGTVASFRSSGIGREIVVDVPSALTAVLADPARVAQVVAILLSNAVKFSPRGGVVGVRARYEWGSRRVVVAVRDSGVGIAVEDQRRLFAPFQRAYNPETKDVHGAGLGLAIVKQLVELMDGATWVESEVGRGSTFYASFPVAAEA